MSKSVFSRRVFLKGSAVAVTALALSACNSDSASSTSCSISGELLDLLNIEIAPPFFSATQGQFDNIVHTEFRLKLTNISNSDIMLKQNNFAMFLDGKRTELSNDRLSNSKFGYLLDQMPIKPGETVKGYLLTKTTKSPDSYKIMITYDNKTAVIEWSISSGSHTQNKPWYE